MRQLTLITLITLALLSACTSVKQIGKLNMISTRNVDSKMEYALVSSYAGGSKKELKKSRAKTIEDAIDQTVRSVPGGEFLKNVKVYIVNSQYFAVEGDVWGTAEKEKIAFRGFKVGDKVTWKMRKDALSNKKFVTGKITSLKSDKACLVQCDEDGKIVELIYDELAKTE